MRLSLLLLSLLALTTQVTRADGIGLSARVVNAEVSYSIASAERSIALREDAVVALAAGDVLTTSRTGRVYLAMSDQLEILVLPNTRLEFSESSQAVGGETVLRFLLNGSAVVRFSDRNRTPVTLEIEGVYSTLRAGEGWFSIWGSLDNSDVITVAGGTITLDARNLTGEIVAGQGTRVGSRDIETADMEVPLNRARLVSILDGCDGRVESLLPALNIRAGTTLGYAEIGFLNNNARVRIVGRTVDRLWYRIQRFSGFGWVLANAVETDCNPPEYPNLYGENNLELFDIEGIELAMLAPFYGSIESDPWFYRWLEPAN